jgi:hypothetical protein
MGYRSGLEKETMNLGNILLRCGTIKATIGKTKVRMVTSSPRSSHVPAGINPATGEMAVRCDVMQ